jgi:hypothetical protein
MDYTLPCMFVFNLPDPKGVNEEAESLLVIYSSKQANRQEETTISDGLLQWPFGH